MIALNTRFLMADSQLTKILYNVSSPSSIPMLDLCLLV